MPGLIVLGLIAGIVAGRITDNREVFRRAYLESRPVIHAELHHRHKIYPLRHE